MLQYTHLDYRSFGLETQKHYCTVDQRYVLYEYTHVPTYFRV